MRTVGYPWHLRQLMAENGMFATTDLVPLLAERASCCTPRSTGWSPAPRNGSTCTSSPRCATSSAAPPPT